MPKRRNAGTIVPISGIDVGSTQNLPEIRFYSLYGSVAFAYATDPEGKVLGMLEAAR